ncbi:MAG: Hint domain-containing protein [Bacteroidota bacterium]
MNTLPVLSSEQQNALRTFQQSLVPGKTTYLDPNNPNHRQVLNTMLDSAGRTDTQYPLLYSNLNNGSVYTGDPVDTVHLVDSGKTSSGKATATVWSSSTQPTVVKGGNLMAFDHDSGELLAHGENTAVKSGFLACPTRADAAQPASDRMDMLYVGHATDEDASTRFYAYSDTVSVSSVGLQATVDAPVISSSSSNADIWIAVGRVAGTTFPSNADYIYLDTQNVQNPNPIVPFVGHIPLSGTIDFEALSAGDIKTNLIIQNSNGTTAVVDRDNQYTTDNDIVTAFMVGSTPNVLQWSFPFDGKDMGNKGYQDTQSIVYETSALTSEQISYFYFAFNSIPLKDGLHSAPFYVCSQDTPEEQSISCYKIKNLLFWWHCLAKGTSITLEDGSTIKVEEINETKRVLTGVNGDSLAVAATVNGKHSSNPNQESETEEKIYHLTTENGKGLTATQTHMIFMSADRCKSIAEFETGDPVMTDAGISTVASNHRIEYSSMFYGLLLGSPQEKEGRNFPHNKANFYANGILTGDHQVMRHHFDSIRHDLSYMLPRLDTRFHQDYTSALNDRRF